MSDETKKTPPESDAEKKADESNAQVSKANEAKAEAKELAEKAEAKEPAERAEAKEPAERAEAKEPAERAEAKKPAEKAEAKKPAEKQPPAKELQEAARKATTPRPARAPAGKVAGKAPTTAADIDAPVIHVAPSPHVANQGLTTRSLMVDVVLGLGLVVIASVVFFKLYAVKVIAITTAACMAFEWIFVKMRGREPTLGDASAAVTGLILALSLPWSTPWWICVIASMIAIGLGKVAFGSLGQNIFNPAMAGRAFVMISFSAFLGAGAYVQAEATGTILSQATPLTAARVGALVPELWPLFLGNTNGSLGETSALASVLGGLYLISRRTASWEVPLAMFVVLGVLGGATQALVGPTPALATMKITVLQHFTSGAFMFGAFFIATDPVTSPLTRNGKFWFGGGISFFIWVLRTFSNYPEGLMFAVLLMNAAVPLINRWTVPTPVGGPVPKRE